MKKKVELPIAEPLFSTYHNQGSPAAVMACNPDLNNWYYNEAITLLCNKRFLEGYTTPEVSVKHTDLFSNKCIQKIWMSLNFVGGFSLRIIKNMLDEGYYVAFTGIDDYYMEGKSWYKQRHFSHDGMIYGYDDEKGIFNVYAYDKNWLYRGFELPQKNFARALKSAKKLDYVSALAAFKTVENAVKLQPSHIAYLLKIYLDPNFGEKWLNTEKYFYGIEVCDALCLYLTMVEDGRIPYERIDWRIFRLIWEHKKVMLERMKRIEIMLSKNNDISNEYAKVVKAADDIRMMYAAYVMRRRDALLGVIKTKLIGIKKKEQEILPRFIELLEGGN